MSYSTQQPTNGAFSGLTNPAFAAFYNLLNQQQPIVQQAQQQHWGQPQFGGGQQQPQSPWTPEAVGSMMHQMWQDKRASANSPADDWKAGMWASVPGSREARAAGVADAPKSWDQSAPANAYQNAPIFGPGAHPEMFAHYLNQGAFPTAPHMQPPVNPSAWTPQIDYRKMTSLPVGPMGAKPAITQGLPYPNPWGNVTF